MTMDEPRKALLRPLPRRKPLAVHQAKATPPRRRRDVQTEASVFRTSQRAIRWTWVILKLLARVAKDRCRGKLDARKWGSRLRELFEEMGGAAVKIGQQLSVRIDILPYEVCRELEQLVDNIPAFPTDQAIDIIERQVGRRRGVERVPLGDIFESFDPDPIGSASVACVYQATLKSGEKVAVKVRRPRIATSIGSDLGVIDWATRALELLTVVRSGFFKNLRSELRSMLAEEIDFASEARYTRLFRYNTRKDRLKWVTAPKVYTSLSGQEVLVMEFMAGFWCTEVLAARENNDRQALAKLAAKGITPQKVGRRLIHYGFWSRFEALFYHADPHHGNIIVQEGGKLVFIDFGSCGTTSRKSKMAQLTILDRLRHNDISGTVEAALSTLEPLPLMDVYSFKKSVEGDFWEWLFAFRDSKSEWWERTQSGLWLTLLEQTRRRHIPIGLETLRLARSVLLIDTMVFRLDPTLTYTGAFNRYERKAMRRGAWKTRRRYQNTPLSHHANTLIKETDDLLSRVRYYAWQAERLVDSIPNEFAGTMTKFSFIASEFLRAGMWIVGGGVAAFLYFYWVRRGLEPGQEWEAVNELVAGLLHSPLELGLALLLLFILYRRVAFRVNDLDVGRQ